MTLAPAPTLTVTSYQRRHLQPIRDLLFHNIHVHSHLDWVDSDQWLDSGDTITYLAWQRGRLVGVLGLSAPLNNSTWIRIAGVSDFMSPQDVLPVLWETIIPILKTMGVKIVGLLGISQWMTHYAPSLGFRYGEEIITLARADEPLPPALANPPRIRVAELRDISQIAAVDQAAFTPPWQMSFHDLRQAYRIASSCTIAVENDRILGFQISTFFFDGAHLARLAVHPSSQGRGVGGALLRDLLERYNRRGIESMTVNTQSSNHQSRNLYERFGFQPNGYDLPYWSAVL
ncbi:MAG: GNAT family N-acetyltransferase [Chloroflexi bacterium]|nr:GNAT family N-acetyltransferase [Chloroflexota bacterium]MCC6894214.1 GNAT family N-acetyltransferase [Anaerolineae bacterium]